MKKILNLLTTGVLISSPVSLLFACCNQQQSESNLVSSSNLQSNSFSLQNSILNNINEYITSTGEIYNFGMNPLSRIYAIKLSFKGYAKITIAAKTNTQESFSYYAGKNNPQSSLVVPILFLYQNYNNKVKIELFNAENQSSTPQLTKDLTINIKQVWNQDQNILNNSVFGSYNKEQNYLFFTSGNNKPVKGKIKSPYMAFDKYGQLRWLIPQNSYDVPLQINSNNQLVMPISFDNLVPDADLSFYPFVESQNLIGLDWVGLKTVLDYNVNGYYANHEIYQQNNDGAEIMIANQKDYIKNGLTPNDAIISVDSNSNITVYKQSDAWNNILLNFPGQNTTPIWQQFNFKFNDWIHLNALSKIDNDNILVFSRALNSIYDYNMSSKKNDWLLTSSDALYNQINKTATKAILVKNSDDLFYGQHGLKYLKTSSDGSKVTFMTLDNQFDFATIAKYDINHKENQNNSYFKEITVDLDNNNYQIVKNFKIDKVSYMGNI